MSRVTPPDVLPVSVVVPAHDRAHVIERALSSVAGQRGCAPAEVIVVDDGSTDRTAELAEEHGARVIRHDRNRGVSAARNIGVRWAAQPWIAWLDSDDEWLPDHLAALWPLRGDHVLVGGALLWVGPGGRAERVSARPAGQGGDLRSPAPLLFPENFLQPSAVLLRRDAFDRAGGFDEGMRLAEDLDLWVRMLELGTGFVTDRVISVYRVHGGQASTDQRAGLRTAHEAIVRRYAGRPWCPPALLERARAVALWDELRECLRARDRGGALRRAARLLSSPVRIQALLRLLSHRRRARAVARQAAVRRPEPGYPPRGRAERGN